MRKYDSVEDLLVSQIWIWLTTITNELYLYFLTLLFVTGYIECLCSVCRVCIYDESCIYLLYLGMSALDIIEILIITQNI